MSRKFIYQQTDKARTALDDAFLTAAPEDEALYWLRVSTEEVRRGRSRMRLGVVTPITG